MIVACRSYGETFQAVKSFAKKARATLHPIETKRLDPGQWKAAMRANVSEIKRLMPRS
jgi:hypothetical protein